MTFTFKLSKRLAQGRATVLAAAAALALAAGCEPGQVAAPGSTAAIVDSIAVTPPLATSTVSDTLRFKAVLYDPSGKPVANGTVSWSTSDTTVASVDGTGLVLARAPGAAMINATTQGRHAAGQVHVAAKQVATVTVLPAASTLTVARALQYRAVLQSATGDTLTGRTVTWMTSDALIATVNATGLLTAKAAGSVTVTATSEGKSGTATLAISAAAGTSHAGWYASPGGSAGGAGSSTSPWSLQTALSGGNGQVQPGDTIWLRGGTYPGTFTTSLTGTSAAPIVVRQYPGERATLDAGSSTGDVLTVNGQYATYWGFEIMSSSTLRTGTAGTGTGVRGDGVYVNGASNVKLINLVVHDVGHGVFTENTAHNITIYGWLIYNGGYQDGVRSDGHGIYLHNDGATWKVVRDNVIFNQFGFGIHGYAESTSQEKELVLDGNVLFNNGTVSSYDNNPNLQLGGNGIADQDSVTNNMLYFTPGWSWINAKIGYGSLVNGSAVVTGNYVVGGSQTLDLGYWQNLAVQGNTVYGTNTVLVQHDAGSGSTQHWSGNQHLHDPTSAAWQLSGNLSFANWQTAANASDQASAATPATKVFVRRNLYEAGRGMIVVYNWAAQGSVSADLSGVVAVGAHYEIRNVQDIYGSPVASGTYGGGSVSVSMSGVTPAPVIGGSPNAPIRTGPYFDTFIVVSY